MTEELYKCGCDVCNVIGWAMGINKEKPQITSSAKLMLEFAKLHNIVPLAFTSLKKYGFSKEQLADFSVIGKKLILRQAKIEIMQSRITSFLDKEKIPFLVLKGSNIQQHYGEEFVRSTNDVDLFARQCDFERIANCFTQNGFESVKQSPFVEEYIKKPYYQFEIHSRLASKSDKVSNYINKMINDTCPQNGKWELSMEQQYVYNLHHVYKHYACGGCGVRLFLDMCVLKNNLTLNNKIIEKHLAKLGLDDFEKVVTELGNYLFKNTPLSDEKKQLVAFVFANGIFGKMDVFNLSGVSDSDSYSKGKISYFADQWALTFSKMKARYTVLEKVPILLPFCYIHKLSFAIKNRNSLVKSQISVYRKCDKEKAVRYKKLMRLSGIK